MYCISSVTELHKQEESVSIGARPATVNKDHNYAKTRRISGKYNNLYGAS